MKIIKTVLRLAIALFYLSACGGPVEGGGTTPDTTPPLFIKGDPVGPVTQACSVTADFDDALLASSINNQSFVIQKNTDANPLSTNDGNWGLSPSSSTIARFVPSVDLVGTYDVTLTTDIKNAAGLNLTEQQTWSFTTSQACNTPVGDTTPPQVVSRTPEGNVASVCSISVDFNEPILESTVTSQSFSIQENGAASPLQPSDGSWGLSTTDNSIALFVPSVNLVGTFTVTLNTAITDLAGNNLAAGQSWTFTASLPCPP